MLPHAAARAHRRVAKDRRAPGARVSNGVTIGRLRVGIITGSGTYALPALEAGATEDVRTRWGTAAVTRGTLAGVEVAHLSRHGEGHVRLSNHVTHRANIAALAAAGCDAVLAVTVCGAVDPSVELGSLIAFDDVHFVANRLADGSLCTFFDEAGDDRRGHWIYEDPYSPELRAALLAGAREVGHPVRDGGCYGHVDGPRFNTKAEIRGLAACGVTAVSQTAGPETVLCGEAELPFALLGYATDYANGVKDEATPVARLLELIAASTEVFARVLAEAVPRIAAASPAGVVYRFHSG
jgi:purine nucleoside phosphorylase